MKLFRAPLLPDHWIGNDQHGAGLVVWPAERRGWDRRTPYTGPRRGLVEVAPSLARGTGWPGTTGGRRPRGADGQPTSGSLTIRHTAEERAAWKRAAGERPLSDWVRELANEAARRG